MVSVSDTVTVLSSLHLYWKVFHRIAFFTLLCACRGSPAPGTVDSGDPMPTPSRDPAASARVILRVVLMEFPFRPDYSPALTLPFSRSTATPGVGLFRISILKTF